MSASRSIALQATFVAAALFVAAGMSPISRAQEKEDTPIRTHITVTSADLNAAANVKSSLFHVMPANVPGAKARVAALHEENAARATELGIRAAEDVPAPVPNPSSPYFYPADLKNGGGPRLATTKQHALYVDFTGTVASNWGNPEGFLKDLNLSSFIHLVDQYVGSSANGRYPVGGNGVVTYGLFGHVLYEHEILAFVHAAAKFYGAGGGHLYHVFLPKGMDTCIDLLNACYSPDNFSSWVFCAYHDAVNFSDIGTVLFTVEPFQDVSGCAVATPSPNGQLADSTNSVLSHETFEAITDPLPGSGYINRTDLVLAGQEIGDECVPLGNAFGDFLDPTFHINGKNYEVQLEYSNTYHACAAQP